jgi:capsular polysaccharide biosynthesis protein
MSNLQVLNNVNIVYSETNPNPVDNSLFIPLTVQSLDGDLFKNVGIWEARYDRLLEKFSSVTFGKSSNNPEYYKRAYILNPSVWAGSFFHLMTDDIPGLYKYADLLRSEDITIFVRNRNSVIEDCLEAFNIPSEKIVSLKPGTTYRIEELVYHENPNSQRFCLEAIVPAFTQIRKHFISQPSKSSNTTQLYLPRWKEKSQKFNNSSASKERIILNEKEVISILKSKGFSVVNLGNKGFNKKGGILKNAERIVCPHGAGCLNAIFAPDIRRVIVLSTTGLSISDNRICKILKGVVHDLDVQTISTHVESDEPYKTPFNVDTEDLVSLLDVQ